MPAEIKKEIQLEIAHVLFMDIVGYLKVRRRRHFGSKAYCIFRTLSSSPSLILAKPYVVGI
jgi:hypothetical protein